MACAFHIDVADAGDRTSVVSVRGELDLASAPQLKWTLVDLAAAGRDRLVIDLTQLDFIDSTALGVLVSARRSAGPEAAMAIASTRPVVLHILEVTGLDASFDIFPTVATALAFVARMPAAAH